MTGDFDGAFVTGAGAGAFVTDNEVGTLVTGAELGATDGPTDGTNVLGLGGAVLIPHQILFFLCQFF